MRRTVTLAILLASLAATVALSRPDLPPAGHSDTGAVHSTFISVAARTHTTITLHSEDSTLLYILFDNELDRGTLLIFEDQDYFWNVERSSDTAIVLPFPKLTAGFYFYRITTPDTSIARRFLMIN